MPKYKHFSKRQKVILTWWMKDSPYKDRDGIIADGSIRSGKSTPMSMSFVFWAMTNFSNESFGMCGKTRKALRRNVLNDLKKTLLNYGYRIEDRRGEDAWIVSKGARTNCFYLFSGNDERSQDSIQGITLAGVLFDEAALMPESFINQATGRCSIEGSKLWFNCNPAGSRVHWFKQGWVNRYKEKNLLYLHFTMDDNPSLSDKMKRRYMGMYAGVFYRRYIEGRWVAAEGAIYDMWSDEENLFDMPELNAKDPNWKTKFNRIIAVDYGTSNPMVFLDMYDDGVTYWIVNEYYYDSRADQQRAQKTDYEYANDLESFIGERHDETIIIDPSAASFSTEMRMRDYRVRKADNDVLDGIRITATLIQRRRVRVLRGACPNFEKEISGYVWDDKAMERGVEQPLKVADHAMDAMRYGIKTTMRRSRLLL